MFSSALIRWSVLLAVAASLLSCERKPELFADQIIWIERATMEGSVWMTPGLECLQRPSANAVEALKHYYRRGGLGDMALKKRLTARLQDVIAPIRERRDDLASRPSFVMDVLRTGTQRGAAVTQGTLDELRTALGMFRFM